MTAMSVMPVAAVALATALKSPPGVVHRVDPLVEFQVTPASVHTFDTVCTPWVRLVGGGLVMVSRSTALVTTPQLGIVLRSNWTRARCLTADDPVRTCRTLSFSWLAFGEPSAIQESCVGDNVSVAARAASGTTSINAAMATPAIFAR